MLSVSVSYTCLDLPASVSALAYNRIASNNTTITDQNVSNVDDFRIRLPATNETDGWAKIIADSEDALLKIEARSFQRVKNLSFSGSRMPFINPNPGYNWEQYEEYNKRHFVLRHCLSEFGLNLNKRYSLLDNVTREMTKRNISCEDLRPLLLSNLFCLKSETHLHFDETSNKENIKRSLTHQSCDFTSLIDSTCDTQKRKEYEKKLEIIQHHSQNKIFDKTQPSLQQGKC